MSPVDGNMEALSQEVMEEARREADQILDEARAKAETILQNARKQAEEERKSIIERARQEAERRRRQAIATVQVQARKLELDQREKLLQKVLETANQQLPTVQQRSDYEQVAQQLLREAVMRLGADRAEVQADETTLKYLKHNLINEVSRELNVELKLKGKLQQGLGVVVETEDGRRRYDNTLDTRLSRMQDSLRAPVYRLLMGET